MVQQESIGAILFRQQPETLECHLEGGIDAAATAWRRRVALLAFGPDGAVQHRDPGQFSTIFRRCCQRDKPAEGMSGHEGRTSLEGPAGTAGGDGFQGIGVHAVGVAVIAVAHA